MFFSFTFAAQKSTTDVPMCSYQEATQGLVMDFQVTCNHQNQQKFNSLLFPILFTWKGAKHKFLAIFFCSVLFVLSQLYKCPERMPRSLCTASSLSAFLFLQKFSCKKCYMYVGLVAPSSLPWNGSGVVDFKNAVKKEKTQGDSNDIFLAYISASLCHWTALFFMGRNVA